MTPKEYAIKNDSEFLANNIELAISQNNLPVGMDIDYALSVLDEVKATKKIDTREQWLNRAKDGMIKTVFKQAGYQKRKTSHKLGSHAHLLAHVKLRQ